MLSNVGSPGQLEIGDRIKSLKPSRILIGLGVFNVWFVGIAIMLLKSMDVTWCVLTGIVLPFSLLWMQREAGIFDFGAVSLPGAWYWAYLVFVLIPSLAAYQLESGNHPDRFIASVLSVLLTVPLGLTIGTGICRARRGMVKAYYQQPIKMQPADFRSPATLIMIGLCVLLGIKHVRELSSVPLLYMIQNPGQAAAMTLLREDALKLLPSDLKYVYEVLTKDLFPILVMLTGMRYLYVKTHWNGTLFVGTFVVAILYCGMTLEKSPVGLAILCLAIALYFKQGGKLSNPWLVGLVLVALFAFPVVVFLFQTKDTALATEQNLIDAVAVRLFYGGAKVLFYYFDLVPDVIPYQNGATIGKYAMLMGMEPSKIANSVGLRIDPTLPKSVSANAPFLGTFYADFGMTGVLIGGVFTGIIIAVIEHYIVRRPKTIRNVCIYGFVMLKLTLLTIAALPYILLSGGVIIALAPLFLEDVLGARRRDAARWGRDCKIPLQTVGPRGLSQTTPVGWSLKTGRILTAQARGRL
jgi:oligosaccharide repeat unit polymerase